MPDVALEVITVWAPIAMLVLSVVNTLTKHYTKFNGWLRVVMSVVERLSFLASKGTQKRIKTPGSSVEPDPILERIIDAQKQFEDMAKRKESRRHSLAGRSKRR